MEQIYYLYEKYKKYKYLMCFLIVFLIILLSNLHSSHLSFYYDASGYWELGKTFFGQGRFNILNYKEALRGYLYPLINSMFYLLAQALHLNEIFLFRSVNAVIVAFLIAVLIPKLFSLILNKEITAFQNLAFCVITTIFWRGYFLYPLSDFPALFALLAGIYIVLQNYYKRIERVQITQAIKYILAGVCIAASVNIRPSYQIIIIPFFFLLFICFYKRVSRKTAAVYIICTVVGLLICFIPQIYINYFNFQVLSPFIQTSLSSYGKSLLIQQIEWGIFMQKYETYIGNGLEPAMRYIDFQGQGILQKENISTISSIGQYIKLLFKYPVDFICIYFRHIFNGIDINYNTPYVENAYENRIIFSMVNYTLWFFIPIFILCYAANCYTLNISDVLNRLKKSTLLEWISFIVFIVLCFTLSANTNLMLENATILIGN